MLNKTYRKRRLSRKQIFQSKTLFNYRIIRFGPLCWVILTKEQENVFKFKKLPEHFGRASDGQVADDDDDQRGEEHAAGLEHVGPDDGLQATDGRVENANLFQN